MNRKYEPKDVKVFFNPISNTEMKEKLAEILDTLLSINSQHKHSYSSTKNLKIDLSEFLFKPKLQQLKRTGTL
jgi:hypothetical protein